MARRAVNSANSPLFQKIMEHIYVATPPPTHDLVSTLREIRGEIQRMNLAQIGAPGIQNMRGLQEEPRRALLLAKDLYEATLNGNPHLIDMSFLSLTHDSTHFPVFGVWSYNNPYFSLRVAKGSCWNRARSYFDPSIPVDLEPYFQESINKGLGLEYGVAEDSALCAEFVGQIPKDLATHVSTCQNDFESLWVVCAVSRWGTGEYNKIDKNNTALIIGRNNASVSSETARYFLLGAFEPQAWKITIGESTPFLSSSC